jgi:hypothetical protein
MKRRKTGKGQRRGKEQRKIFSALGSAELIEKAQSGEANPSQSKLFSLIFFARAWVGLAGF